MHFGSDKEVLIQLQAGYPDTLGSRIIELLQRDITSTISLRRIEFVGPQVGDELKEQGGPTHMDVGNVENAGAIFYHEWVKFNY